MQQLRQQVVHTLWQRYRKATPQVARLEFALQQQGITKFTLDHFAVIDLPGPHSGITLLSQLFASLGFCEKGRGYLADKQNDFLWMAAEDSHEQLAQDAIAQAVVADFRLEEMPIEIRKIIEKYAQLAAPSPLTTLPSGLTHDHFIQYLSGRDWPMPTVSEFLAVQAFNELLAFVLVFGRTPNHFTLSVHLLPGFTSLENFLCFVENEAQLELNHEGGLIKGSVADGIAQGATRGSMQTITLADGVIRMPTHFIEFVWRYPRHDCATPQKWGDYFTDFVQKNADSVIESLYVSSASSFTSLPPTK